MLVGAWTLHNLPLFAVLNKSHPFTNGLTKFIRNPFYTFLPLNLTSSTSLPLNRTSLYTNRPASHFRRPCSKSFLLHVSWSDRHNIFTVNEKREVWKSSLFSFFLFSSYSPSLLRHPQIAFFSYSDRTWFHTHAGLSSKSD